MNIMWKVFSIFCLSLTISTFSEGHENCGTLVRSICSDKTTTKWNSKSVGGSLRKWIESVSKITSMKESDKEHIFLRKIAIQFEPKDNTGSRVQYITNVDCQTKKRVGPTWMKPSTYSQNLLHDGFLYGMENENGEMTGENIAFVYPDMVTVLIGTFVNGTMIAAKQSKIVRERCNKGIKEIEIAKPKENSIIYKYQRPTRVNIGDQPRVMDPYTKKNIYIGDGKKDDGVFAKRDIFKGELVAYYSGLFVNTTEQALYTMGTYKNQTEYEFWAIHRNLMTFEGKVQIHIPEPYWNISNYRATLGHKLNHSFIKDKTIWGRAFHPRFGHIRSVVAKENIKQGEEMIINYGYRVGTRVQKWTSDLYLEETGKQWYAGQTKQQGSCGCKTKN